MKETESRSPESRSDQISYWTLVEQVADAIAVCDLHGNVLDANPAACEMLGYSLEEFQNLHVTQIIAPEDLERQALRLEETVSDETIVKDRRLCRKDGTRVSVEVRARLLPDKERIQIIARDLTSTEQSTAALRESEQRYRELFASAQRQAQELSLMDRVRTAIARELNLSSLFRTVVEAVAETYGYTQVSLYLVMDGVLEMQHQVGYDSPITRIPIKTGVAARVALSGKPVFLADVKSDPEFIGAIKGIVSEVCVPLFDRGKVAGLLNVESTQGVSLTEADLTLMMALSEQVGIAIERARLYSEATAREADLRRRNEELTLLHETTLGVINRLNVNGLLEVILTKAADLMGTSHGFIHVIDPESKQMIIRVASGVFAALVGDITVYGEGVSGRVWETGKPLAVSNYNKWPGHLANFGHLRTVLSVPLLSGQDVVGLVGLAYLEEDREVSDDEMALLIRFAHMASVALENASLYEAAQEELAERKRLEQQLAYQAFHDALTGLPNRALFMDRLEKALLRRHPAGNQVALLFLDLDDFKLINDNLGHRAGDLLLIEVSKRILECVRVGDSVARFGGDEFTVLLDDVRGEQGATITAERIITRLKAPFTIDGHSMFVNTSIGIALGEPGKPDKPDAGALLRNADVAMYEAKGTGKARFQVYNPNLESQVWHNLQLEFDLRRAIERGEFTLYYQPVVNLSTRMIAEVESLVRWNHPERGVVPPSEFIPLAEKTGLILPLGQWVLEQACRQMREWLDQGLAAPSMVMSVNLSARQFHHQGLVQDIERAVAEVGLPPHCLKMEITESAAMEGIDSTLRTLHKLRDLGIRLAIDDFGIGYSALSYLNRYPVDTLKLDRSFLEGISRDSQSSAIIKAIVAFAGALNLTVTAEGIETAQQVRRVRALGCDHGQGYYFARPMPASTIAPRLLLPVRPPRVRASV